MGYQRVDVRLTNNREIKDALVFKAEEIELPDYSHKARSELSSCSADPPTKFGIFRSLERQQLREAKIVSARRRNQHASACARALPYGFGGAAGFAASPGFGGAPPAVAGPPGRSSSGAARISCSTNDSG